MVTCNVISAISDLSKSIILENVAHIGVKYVLTYDFIFVAGKIEL